VTDTEDAADAAGVLAAPRPPLGVGRVVNPAADHGGNEAGQVGR
jgi:hypothetical protein